MTDSKIDTTLGLLASRRRRLVIRRLGSARGEWVAVSTLADWIAERSGDFGGAAVRRSVETDLHHVQLPKLAAAGVIDYDPALGRVRYLGGPAEELVDHVLGLTEALRP